MIKVSNEYLDFDDVIEMEKQIKLFEDISTTDGDFSYAFELQKTLHNTRLLNNPFPDNISKLVYQRIPAQILNDAGAVTYSGYLRIERITQVYECSFFSGNNNWFAMIDGQLQELDLSVYDTDQTQASIIASWSNTEGIVFPFVDNGGLVTRSIPEVKVEDFVGALYVKTIFKNVFTTAGIKIQGELLEDWRYNNLICISTAKDHENINARSTFARKTDNQVIPNTTETAVTYDNDFTEPYFDGSEDNFNVATGEYTADVKMIIKVESTLRFLATTSPFNRFTQFIKVNGVVIETKYILSPDSVIKTNSLTADQIKLEAGDVLTVTVYQTIAGPGTGTIVSGSLKITPTYLYRTFGSSSVPNWTNQQFVSNVLRIFNVLPSYDAGTATLTLNLFEKIKNKPAIDLSPYISETEIDYQEFISDYGQNSLLSYNEVEFKDLEFYNKGRIFKYGQGSIQVGNGFLEPTKNILESDFSNPVDYVNAVFDASIGKTNLIELEEDEEVTFDDVADNGAGLAAFNISSEIFAIGDLVRIYDSSNPGYNGDYIVDAIPSGHVVFDAIPFETAAAGKIVKLNYEYSSDENAFLFINIPNYGVTNFAGNSMFFDDGTEITSTALAYFDMINTARQVNHDFIYSLSFGASEDPLRYQTNMVNSYFRLFSSVLNDPVRLISTCVVPFDVYSSIDFLSPIKILTEETQNVYYLNRISGYKESYMDSEWQLIKLPTDAQVIPSGVITAPSSGDDPPSDVDPGPALCGLPYELPFELECSE